jgi:O-antigen ligase
MLAAIWIALGAVPLAVAPGIFKRSDLTLKLLMVALAAVLAMMSVPEWYWGLVAISRCRIGKLYLTTCGLLCASLLLSTVLSPNPALALAGTTWRRFGLVTQAGALLLGVMCAAFVAQNPSRLKAAFSALPLTGFVVACFGISQYFGFDPIFERKWYTSEYKGLVRPPATLEHAIYFAAFLLPGFFIAAASALEARQRRTRVLLFGCLLLFVAAIAISGTRSALLGLLAGTIVFLVCFHSTVHRRHAIIAAMAGLVLLASLVLLYHSTPRRPFRGRMEQWVQDARGGPRLLAWRDTLALVRKRPLLGAGPETFAAEFLAVESVETANAYPDSYMESPHNLTLEILTAQGALGLTAATLLVLLALYAGLRASLTGSTMAGAMLAATVALLVSLQFIPLTVPIALCLCCLAGAQIALCCPALVEAQGSLWLPRFTLAPIVAILAIAGVSYAVQDFEFASAGRSLKNGDLPGAISAYRRAHALPFPRPGDDLWLSRQFSLFRQSAAASPHPSCVVSLTASAMAMVASASAERHSDEPFLALYQSALLAIESGDSAKGAAKLRDVIRRAPTWFKPHFVLSQLLIVNNQLDDGAAETAKAARLAGKHREEIKSSTLDLLAAVRRAHDH